MDPLLFSSAVHNDHHDFSLPASPHSNLYDISPHQGSPYDSFDLPDPSHFPHTPSYNGSYQNSPYSNLSDLPPIDGVNDSLGLQDNPSGISIIEEYDPSEYDVPSSGGPLILDEHYMNGTHVSVSLTPPLNDYSSPNAFDHPSPASSNGAEDDGHSHASSNSSYMHPSSPRPDISQTFQDSLSFRSPAWPPSSLPPDDRRSPPLNKPQSPPQLVIPDTTSPGGVGVDSPPIINAPDGDGGLIGSGPTLQIVPATPVSGGGGAAQAAPFRDPLANLQSGGSANATSSDSQDWARHQQFGAPGGQFADQPFTFPGSSSSSALADDGAQQQQQYQSQRGQQFLLPQAPQRSRSLSDTSIRPPPVWDASPMNNAAEQRQGGTVNLNDVLPGPVQGQSSDPLLQHSSFRGAHPSSAGPHQTAFGNQLNSFNSSQYANDFLTVDGASGIRRAKSDGGRSLHTRQARSLDIRPSNSLAPNPDMLFPPAGASTQEFMRRQFLHPAESVPSIRSGPGHHRRSSSGSRERGIGGMMGLGNGGAGGGGMGMGGGMVAGWTGSSASSARASPYPSPSASPRPGYARWACSARCLARWVMAWVV
ncbi:hypothetical protein C8Q77DRAFT_608028 [Trametes polyzona]|nr:hypothetical protein C8Q77DRAFT_608028 [Trametes polyzona]